MKKQTVALIDNINYCPFPDGIRNIQEFVAFLNENHHSFVELKYFVEEGCVAPFYIEEDLKTEKRYYNTALIRHVKETDIFVLPRVEYEEKLQKVIAEKCVHCANYIEDACEPNLKAFIEKIDLNGDCYLFEKKQ